ncbi:MAG: AAA family ATPase [Bacteroidota bacterium]
MNTQPNKLASSTISEVNLKLFVRKLLEHKWLFIISVPCFMMLALIYNKIASPVYEVQSSLLIETSGQSRMLGESQYMEGGLGQIGTEKNLYNEIGILKSYKLIRRTLQALDFRVSYHAKSWYKSREYYGYFPFEVILIEDAPQAFDLPITLLPLSGEKFRLKALGKKIAVSQAANNSNREVSEIDFQGIYAYGDTIQHAYFNFIIQRVDYPVEAAEFKDQELSFVVHDLNDLVTSYQDKLKVEQFDIQASILNLRTKGAVLEKEVRFLRKLTELFISSKYLERVEIAASKERFIENQLTSIADSLADAERALESFKKGANAVDLTRTASNGLDRLQNLEADKGQMEINIRYYRSLLEYIDQADGIEKIVAPSVVGINAPILNENLLELKRLNTEKTRLQFIKGKQSYDLEIIDRQIKNTTNSLKENIRNLIQSSRMALGGKNQQIAKLERTIDQLPSNEKQLLNFQRKRNLYENLFNYLKQELAKTGIARAENIADTKVLDEARMVGNGPVSPQKAMNLILAFLMGLMLPTAWIVFADSFTESIHDLDHLKSLTTIPVTAAVYQARQKGPTQLNLPSEWQAEESFRNVAASLQFQLGSADKTVIGICSSISKEGKTYCTVNLGATLAREGKKVLLMDLNFRHPQLYQTEKQPPESGLVDYLKNQEVRLENILHADRQVNNLHYIQAGAFNGNPHELLNSHRLKALLEGLRAAYDYILLDTPALQLVADYLLIAPLVDVNIFVLHSKHSRISFINSLQETIDKGSLEQCFLLLNGSAGPLRYSYPYPRPAEARKKRLNLADKFLRSKKRPA